MFPLNNNTPNPNYNPTHSSNHNPNNRNLPYYLKSTVLFFLLTSLLFLLMSCGNSNEQKIGVLLSKSEESPYFGAREGIELAKKLLEAEDQVLVFRNATCDKANDIALAEELITQEKVIAIIGGCDQTSLAISELADKHKVVFITPTSSRTDLGKKDYTFQLLTSDQQQISFAVTTIINEGFNVLGIIYDNTPYNQKYANLLNQNFEKVGGKVGMSEPYNEANLTAILNKLKSSEIDALFFAFNDSKKMKLILKKMQSLNFEKLIFPTLFGSEKLKTLSIASIKSADGLMLVSSENGNQQFFTQFFENNKALPTLYSAQGYASFQLLYQLINQGVENGEELKNKLNESEIDTSLGKIKFDPNHTINQKMNLYIVINGEFLER